MEIANNRLRRPLAYKKSSHCTIVKIGDTALFYEAQGKESTPRRWGPALFLDIDEAGVTAKCQVQTFLAAGFCVREKGEEKDVGDAESDPMRERFRRFLADLGSPTRQVDVGEDMEVDREDGNFSSGAGAPESDSGPRPEMIPVPDSPRLSAQ